MTGIIFYKNKKAGLDMLNIIKTRYTNYMFNIQSVHPEEVRISNGDIWKLVPATIPMTCGRRCQIAYIERAIDKEIFYSIIMPCLTSGPYTAFNFYGEGNLKVNDQIELPFKR